MFLDRLTTLLSEPNFMKFLSYVNEEYLEKHNTGQWSAILAGYDSFEVSLPQWNRYAETNGIFKKIAIEHLKSAYIHGSWKSLNEELEGLRKSDPKKLKDMVKQLSVDIADLKSRISQRDYFAPIQNEVLASLERINTHSWELVGVKVDKELPAKDDNSTVLIWRGGVGTLCTLVKDLSTKKILNDKSYLSASPKQIINFILANFTDENGNNFEYNSVYSYIYKKDKVAELNRIEISNAKPSQQ